MALAADRHPAPDVNAHHAVGELVDLIVQPPFDGGQSRHLVLEQVGKREKVDRAAEGPEIGGRDRTHVDLSEPHHLDTDLLGANRATEMHVDRNSTTGMLIEQRIHFLVESDTRTDLRRMRGSKHKLDLVLRERCSRHCAQRK